MKNPPYHIESVTCEDQVGCTILSQVFRCRQYAIFMKAVEVGQLAVQVQLFTQINLHQVFEDWSLHANYQAGEIRNSPTTSGPNYLFVLVRLSNSARKLVYLIRSERVR